MVDRYPGGVTKVALDSAVRIATQEAMRRVQECEAVRKKLAPYMPGGEELAMDAADTVDRLYRRFLNRLGIGCDGIYGAGLAALADQAIRHTREGGGYRPPMVSDSEIAAWETANNIPHRNVKRL